LTSARRPRKGDTLSTVQRSQDAVKESSALPVIHYDAIVVGAGQGGGPLASALARAGRRTALIEREHVGGTCINEGCTPTKTMIASARVAYLARRAADFGVNAGPVSVDLAAVRERKDAVVRDFRTSSERRIGETPGLDLLRGEARFTGPTSLRVELGGPDEPIDISAGLIVLDVGTRPAPPPLSVPPGVRVLDSTSIMELDTVPDHLIVLGGGYVGLEFGQMFRRFGSRVTIVQRGPRLLSREDDDVADAVAAILRDDGIDVLLECEATAITPTTDGGLRVAVRGADGERMLHASQLLAAIGRVPNTERLELDAAGVATDKRGFVQVDARLATNVPGIYALGEVTGGPAFTHISYDDFRILRTNLIESGNATTTGRLVPYVVFTDPQLGRVGLSEREARQNGRAIRVARLPMRDVARAIEVDETRGFLKAVVDAKTDQIVGFAALGLEAGEIMAAVEVAMMGKLPAAALRDGIFAHPTLAESLNTLFANLEE
jgi:pyruvate/2-oxoglutarate dehydrogenase complex dihydrolipoamide dehydrogenase (E3) component